MTSPEGALAEFFDMVHVYGEGDGAAVTIECNWCSKDDYVFVENETYPMGSAWLPRLLSHARRHHKEEVADLLGS